MLENVLKDLLKIRLMNILENYDNGVDDILNIVNDINSYDAHLEDLRYYDNDSYFFDIYYCNNPYEVARACTYGNYDFTDAYVKIDDDNNLTSINYYDLKVELKDSMEEIIDEIIALKNEIFKYNDTLQNIFNEYKKIEEIYDTINDKIDEEFKNNIEWVIDDFYSILEGINDVFNIDIDIEVAGNYYPVYKFILSLNYENDYIETIYILDFEEDDKNNITFLEIEDVKVMEV